MLFWSADNLPTLNGVLFLRRKGNQNAHAILNEHLFAPGYCITHDFLARNVEEEVDEYADICLADYVAQFLNKSRPKLMVSQ
jgi:sulfur transfer complex TusBCD TusB component (DsrH family)